MTVKIHINKNLAKYASINPTKESRQVNIFDLCKGIETQRITLPLYQRDLSWTLQKSIDLLNYLLKGKAPVSPISINVITDKSIAVTQVSFIDREIVSNYESNQFSVVDGQQRLTTNYKAYSNHEDLKHVVLDLGKGSFIEITSLASKNQIPVGILLNKEDSMIFNYMETHKSLSEPYIMSILLAIRAKIKSYSYTINSANDLTEDEQIQWFEVLNNAGSRVTAIQMSFSKLKEVGIDIYNDYTKKYVEAISERGFDLCTPYTTTVSYPIAALNPAYEFIVGQGYHQNNFAPISSDSKENQLCKLKPEQLKECFEVTLKALREVLDFIDKMNLKAPSRVDYINYLIGYFIFNKTPLNESQESSLIEWYNNTEFTNKSNSARREAYTELLRLK